MKRKYHFKIKIEKTGPAQFEQHSLFAVCAVLFGFLYDAAQQLCPAAQTWIAVSFKYNLFSEF